MIKIKKNRLSAAVAAAIVVISFVAFYSTTIPQVTIPEQLSFRDKDELVVVMPRDMPGIFIENGVTFGYQYDIMKAYADGVGMQLRVVTVPDAGRMARMLGAGKADIALGVSRELPQTENSTALYSTSFVVVSNRKTANGIDRRALAASLYSQLEGKKIIISQSFKSSKTYGTFLDSLKGTDIFVSSAGWADVAADVAKGKYDFYVCEKSEAQLVAATNGDVRKVYEIEEDIAVSVAFGSRFSDLSEDFAAWFSGYGKTNEFTLLTHTYYKRGAVDRLAANNSAKHSTGHVISPYDHVMREVGEREGADWRLMAAIAYCESRFSPDAVSRKGAKGLMQIMPVVARQFGVEDEDVMTPEVNITLAVKLLNKIEDMMKFPESVPYNDRMSLVLASYNGGVGHVSDARKLAAKYGHNPNSWEDVAYFLKKKAEPEYYGDEVVSSGRFRGSVETLAFVDKVMGRYNSYCTIAAR